MQRTFVLILCAMAYTWHDSAAAAGKQEIIFATTTSTQDTGLLDELVPGVCFLQGYMHNSLHYLLKLI
jgi:ABC-type tungstate transport system permease subunit